MEQVLYSLPDGWKYQKLKTLIKMHYGKALKAVDRIQGDVPVYGSNGIVGSHNEHLWSQPTVVIGRKGSVGEANLSLTPSWTIDTAYYVEIIDQEVLDLMYFYHFADRFDVSSISQKGVKPGINRNDYLNLSFPLPPLKEQKRIVEKLDALLTRIDTAIEHLQESVTLADALSKNGLSEIFESLKDRYEVVPLSSVVKINSGIALPKLFKSGFSDGDIPFFKVAQMNNHHETMVAPEITFNETVAKEHKIKLFPKGSTLIPKRGGAILTNKKRMLLEDASYDSNIMGLKADESKISDEYLFAFMRTIDLANFVDASTIPQVNNKHIDQMQIPLASIEEQTDVVSRVNLLVKKVETMNSEIQRQLDDLQALKSSILDSAFKGEL
ncbi:restriction endonuclease subunit S [bacterium 19MO03SA05]|uniref:Restriction endonuclease subunit S n=1 Tax=bacterium 19MO03SA05 TaxID=2920620 RepID=A0AAU6VE98_UNCXX|nr:restriction endonuclease subunit S [Vibrio metschnikovii]